MNTKHIILSGILALCSAVLVRAQCRINLMALPINQEEGLTDAINNQLANRFIQMFSSEEEIGVGTGYSQFFITARFANSYKETLAGPPEQHVVRTTLTIWIGDLENKSIFSSCSVELRGVGTSETRAYTNALRQLKANSPQLQTLVTQAHDRILGYYDSNYQKILQKANTAATQNNYDEALMYLGAIPECCSGYSQAQTQMINIFHKRCNYEGQRLLTEAQGVWAANPTDEGAAEAMSLINEINPAASCYSQVPAFVKKMQSVVKANWDFENKTKYQNEVKLREQEIAAAKAIGVARAKNQPKTIINNRWYWW